MRAEIGEPRVDAWITEFDRGDAVDRAVHHPLQLSQQLEPLDWRETCATQRFHRALAEVGIETRSSRWEDLLRVALAPSTIPTIIAIDQAPYLLEVNAGWASVLQHEWDRVRDREHAPGSLLVLTGSAIATMTSIISSGGALYERPTATIRLDPLDLPTSHDLLGRPDAERTVEAYAACGGYPLLLNRWDPTEDAHANLVRLAGDTFGALAANASALLLDLPDPAGHRRVLTAIGRGAHKLSEISARAARADRSLATLEGSRHARRSTR